MQVYLASAALKARDFDLAATVELAAREGFAGVQLYVNAQQADDRDRLERTARLAHEAALAVLVHLPSCVTPAIARAARQLLRFQKRPRAIVHYEPDSPMPAVEGVQVGLENAIAGVDERYYARWLAARRDHATFLAFDVPRLFGRRRDDPAPAYAFAERMLERLQPGDVLHLIDQRRAGGRRADWCVLGRGLLAPLLPRIVARGGPIVLEFENPTHARKSKAVLEKLARRAASPFYLTRRL